MVPVPLALIASAAAQSGTVTREDAYLWAYPLVVTARTVGGMRRNALSWHDALPTPAEMIVPRPNPDLIYGVAPLDLSGGPVLLDVPDIEDRYWSVQVMDPWTETVGYLGTRATGGDGGVWQLAGPDVVDPSPPGTTRWPIPSTGAVLIVRIGVSGSDDLDAALALRDRFALTSAAPPPPPPGSAGPTSGAGQNGISFWDEVGAALAWASPTPAEAAVADALAAVGVGPGRQPSVEVTDPALRRLYSSAANQGADTLRSAIVADAGLDWTLDLSLGTYDGDWMLRASTARTGWGANAAEEAVYTGALITGPTRLRFEPGEEPPVDAFWSVAVYDTGGRLFANAWDRYSLQSGSPALVPQADGAIEILFAPDPPAAGTDNWLPMPVGHAMVMLRLYLPGPAVLDGAWQPPALRPVPHP